MKVLRTNYQERIARRNEKILTEYRKLIEVPENTQTAVVGHLSTKYDISPSTIHRIVKAGGSVAGVGGVVQEARSVGI